MAKCWIIAVVAIGNYLRYGLLAWLGRRRNKAIKDLLRNHWPKVLPCITLVFGGKGVKVAWIYVNCPWRAHDLGQVVL